MFKFNNFKNIQNDIVIGNFRFSWDINSVNYIYFFDRIYTLYNITYKKNMKKTENVINRKTDQAKKKKN